VGPFGRKSRPSVEKVGEWYVESWYLQGYSPCLCRLRTDGLAPTSKYWTYRSYADVICPVNLAACHRQKLGLSLLLHWLAWRETGYGPADRSASVLWIMSGSLFLCSSGIRPNLSASYKKLICVDHMRYIWSRVIHGPSVESVWRVDQVFSCKIYIDLNRHDSQIWVTVCLMAVFT
jgi:hypothetical protein